MAIASRMVKTQGMGSLYKGLSAGLLRQATYTTARLGIYNNIFEAAKQYNDNKVRLRLLRVLWRLQYYARRGTRLQRA